MAFSHRHNGLSRFALPVFAGFLLLAADVPNAQAQAARESLFGTTAKLMGTPMPFSQWTALVARMRRDPWPFDERCEASTAGHCEIRQWDSFLSSIQNEGRMSQLRDVNDFMNAHPYILSWMNWGRDVYWETPLEFLWKSGQCEDYAIAKYMSLRVLGFAADTLRIVVAQDRNLNLSHAILVVYLDGFTFVLDNQIGRVVQAKSVRQYSAIYSFNEANWWIHRDIVSRQP